MGVFLNELVAVVSDTVILIDHGMNTEGSSCC